MRSRTPERRSARVSTRGGFLRRTSAAWDKRLHLDGTVPAQRLARRPYDDSSAFPFANRLPERLRHAFAVNESSSTITAAIPNVLAERYASKAMKDIWSQHGRVALERDFWIAVMKGQRDLGVPIPAEAIKDYEKIKATINLASIAKRERVTLHDVKARIEEFSELAKRQFIHLGLTSRDLTENVEQLQVFRSLKLVHFKTAAALLALAQQAEAHRDLMITGRTHNVPAQPTTLGKRLAMFGQELLVAFTRIEELLARYP